MKLSTLDLDDNVNNALTEIGYSTATPIQEQTIPKVLSGLDVMARAQTGSGKTAAFALPLLSQLQQSQTPNTVIEVLVLVPTRELAKQVHQSFINYGKFCDLQCAIVYGGVSTKTQIETIKAGVNVLVATPGRLLDLLLNNHVDLATLKSLVLDEADRILDLGFKQEIDRIFQFLPAKHQTLLFSATFNDEVYKLSKGLLTAPEIINIDVKNTVAAGIEQIIYTVDSDRKRELTSYLIGSKNWQQVLIFTRTKQGADALAKEMCKDGLKTLSLHGDKSQGAREKALSDFKAGKCRVLVATDVAARGLDINTLDYVINYELPYVADDYIHRIGRTARAGKFGTAVSLMSPSEEWLLSAIEEILEYKLMQQWYPGYEPDLTKTELLTKAQEKKRTKKRVSGNHHNAKNGSSGNSKRKSNRNYKR